MSVLDELVKATRQIGQTRQRLDGQTPDGSKRRDSLHNPDARPIAKGRLGKPVEVGHKAQLVEGDDGVIVDHNVECGTPPMHPNWHQRWAESQSTPAVPRAPSPLTAAMGRKVSRTTCMTRGQERGHPPQGQTIDRPKDRGTQTSVPTIGEVANRRRRQDQHTQTRIRVGQDPDRRHRRSPDLGRTRSPGTQPDQDQRPRRLRQARTGVCPGRVQGPGKVVE